MKFRLNRSEMILWIFTVISSVVISMVAFAENTAPDYYKNLYLIPILYALVNIIFANFFENIFNYKKSIVKIILFLTLYIRHSIAILFLVIGNYAATLNKLTYINVNKGIFLMSLEVFFIYLYVCFSNNGKNNSANVKDTIKIKNQLSNKHIKIFGICLLICMFFCIYAYFTSSLVKNTYKPIWDSSLVGTDNYFLNRMTTAAGSKERIIYTLFCVIFDITRILLPCWIIFFIRKSFGEKLPGAIIGLLMCIWQLSMIGNETVFVLLVIVLNVLLIMKLYPKYEKLILKTMIIMGGCVFAYLFIWISGTISNSKNALEGFSNMFQVYFPGISNISAGFNVVDNNKINTLFFDLYEAIPFHNSLFGIEGDRLSVLYNNSNGVKYTITPCITQLYHYFWYFAPFISILIVKCAYYYEKKLKNSKNVFSYISYSILVIYLSMLIVCYYPTLILSRYLSTILPLILISKYAGSKYDLIERK